MRDVEKIPSVCFFPSQLSHHLAARASRPAEDLERLTGEITGHSCQPWQTGTRLAPNVQYETQITNEEWEEEARVMCTPRHAFMLRMWLIEEIRGLGKDEGGKCSERQGTDGRGWISSGVYGVRVRQGLVLGVHLLCYLRTCDSQEF